MACAWEPRVSESARQRRIRVERFIIAIVIVQQTCQKKQWKYLCETRTYSEAPPLLRNPKSQSPSITDAPITEFPVGASDANMIGDRLFTGGWGLVIGVSA